MVSTIVEQPHTATECPWCGWPPFKICVTDECGCWCHHPPVVERIAALEKENKALREALKEIEEGTFEKWARKVFKVAMAREGE